MTDTRFEIALFEIVLIISFGLLWLLVVYHHLIYPWLLNQLSQQIRPDYHREPLHCPTITIVIPAYNEAAVIEDKVRNLGMLDYPPEKLDIIVACDGCTDNTADLAVRAANEPENRHLNVRVWNYSDNLGKTRHLNRVLPLVRSDITALSDASALISYDALRVAAGHFHNPEIGVVAGSYLLAAPGSAGEASYWRYQCKQKLGESQLGGPIGVHGALYFYRSLRFQPLDEDIINDDFVLPMRIVAGGSRAIYEPDIRALELETVTPANDMKRRSRIAAGNFQQLVRLPQLLNPALGGVAFAFGSGKALRALMPLILPTQLLIALLLAITSPSFAVISAVQLIGIAASLLLFRLWGQRLPAIICAPCYLVCGYLASLRGIIRYLMGLESGPWHPVQR